MNGDIGIGKLIDQERGRDAIHVAVAPVVASCSLVVGSHVCILPDGTAGYGRNPIGIVDPFLKKEPQTGDRFYLFLYPGSITSLAHHWVHPAFKEVLPPTPAATPDQKTISEAWLREYACRVNPQLLESYGTRVGSEESAYSTLLEDLQSGELTYHGIDMHSRSELIDEAELCYHASIVLGRPILFDYFRYFSCTC